MVPQLIIFIVIHTGFNWNEHVKTVIKGGDMATYFNNLERDAEGRRIQLGFEEDEKDYCYIGISEDGVLLYYYCPALLDKADLVSVGA